MFFHAYPEIFMFITIIFLFLESYRRGKEKNSGKMNRTWISVFYLKLKWNKSYNNKTNENIKIYQNHALLSRKPSLVNVKWPIAVMNRVKYNCHYILDSCIVIYTVVSDFSWHSFSTKQVVLQTLRKKVV